MNEFRTTTWLKYQFGKLCKAPDFLIVGVQKGGTTTLFEYLSQHPKVSISRKKEIHYFDQNYNKGESWYKSHFPTKYSDKITGEATPYYLFHPEACNRLRNCYPNIKIIILLRDPIERAYSHFCMEKRFGIEPLNHFEDALTAESDRLASIENFAFNHQHFSYWNRSNYRPQIDFWMSNFDHKQFLILKSEELFTSPNLCLTKVFSFLELSTLSGLSKIHLNKGQCNLSQEQYNYFEEKYFKSSLEDFLLLTKNK